MREHATLVLKLFRGEPAISAFDWHFTSTHSSSLNFSTLKSSALHGVLPPLQPRFRFGSGRQALTSPHTANSPDHSSIGTPSRYCLRSNTLRLLVGTRFQFLFHSPPGVLFTFPSRY